MPLSVLRGGRTVRVGLGGREVTVRIVTAASTFEAAGAIPHTEPFWFAVAAFRPNVRIAR